jgi:predicted transcriptional regulator
MSRAPALPGGKLEYAVLVALWEGGPLAARAVHGRVGEPLGLAYTTTAKVLDRLAAKGLVGKAPSGKTFIYTAVAERPATDRARALQALGELFGSGVRPAVATLVDAMTAIDPDLLDELARVVEARRRSRREP